MNFPYTAPFFGSIICLEFTIGKGNPIRENCCSWKAECVKFLLVESGILGFGIRNTAQVIRNPTNDWSLESKFYLQRLKSSTWNPESMAWNPESKTVLDSLTWANEWLTFPGEGCLPFFISWICLQETHLFINRHVYIIRLPTSLWLCRLII